MCQCRECGARVGIPQKKQTMWETTIRTAIAAAVSIHVTRHFRNLAPIHVESNATIWTNTLSNRPSQTNTAREDSCLVYWMISKL